MRTVGKASRLAIANAHPLAMTVRCWSSSKPKPHSHRQHTSQVSATDQRTQNVLQDAVVAVVVRLAGGIDTQHGVEVDDGSVSLCRCDVQRLWCCPLVESGHPRDGEGLGPVQPERVGALAGWVLKRKHTHADQVRSEEHTSEL